ncbi:hypothetical protein [Streptomyces sp. NBC_00280]|uniref:hypothetical protein n=1 Tax=Streptomyces sp. NBC_00280 TaxID=2975699 RepID=UPI00324FA0C5
MDGQRWLEQISYYDDVGQFERLLQVSCWVVTAPVARAVTVLERCRPADEPYLFAHPLARHAADYR